MSLRPEEPVNASRKSLTLEHACEIMCLQNKRPKSLVCPILHYSKWLIAYKWEELDNRVLGSLVTFSMLKNQMRVQISASVMCTDAK